ncbi:MAG: helix-turn-helix domain-containing protein [Deltaproteobacteria bacterium]|nr:helix-turn-helix domain-containing protein [Deltaproteobacteria bacterium]
MTVKKYISTTEAAKILGISTVAVFKKIKSGLLPAQKVGRNYIIDPLDLGLKGGRLSRKTEKQIGEAVKRVVSEYGEALKKLGRE